MAGLRLGVYWNFDYSVDCEAQLLHLVGSASCQLKLVNLTLSPRFFALVKSLHCSFRLERKAYRRERNIRNIDRETLNSQVL